MARRLSRSNTSPRGRAMRLGQPASHILQLATAMLLCQADGRVDRAPREGWIRYIDACRAVSAGRGGPFENTPMLRERVIALVQRMRRAIVTGAELHREHRSPSQVPAMRAAGACEETA